MYKIAITGGIASGKSLVMSLLRDRGELVVSCDDINRELLCDSEYIAKLGEIFPSAVSDNVIDKSMIRDIIALDSGLREQLNNLSHGEISRRLHDILDNSSRDIAFAEVPLLFESGMQSDFDSVWLVVSSDDIRVSRLMSRDNISYDSAASMMSCQMSDEDKAKLASVVITNHSDEASVRMQIDNLLK